MLRRFYRLFTQKTGAAFGLVGLATLMASCARDLAVESAPVLVTQQLMSPPGNDNFANATEISEVDLPFSEALDLTEATTEALEPSSSCWIYVGNVSRSVWYTIEPTSTGWLGARITNAVAGGVVAVYTGDSFDNLAEVGGGLPTGGCDWEGKRLEFEAESGTRYYIQVRDHFNQSTSLQFRLEVIPPPPNDNFADATAIGAIPFSDMVDLAAAKVEAGEPTPSCVFGTVPVTAWYRFAPSVTQSVTAFPFFPQFSAVVVVYQGTSLSGLTEKGCTAGFGGRVIFRAQVGTTYYLQVGGQSLPGTPDNFGPLELHLEVTPDPIAQFSLFPSDPSAVDNVQFSDNSFDPAFVGVETREWNFGDGATATTTDCCVTHQYAADGSYTVQLMTTTFDGRTASTSQVVQVRTHDVAITKFTVPKAASAGQTRAVTVGINSRRYPETVQVQLFTSIPGGVQQVGLLIQSVPVRPSNRTTDFNFSYTFTSADAQVGKVTFRAIATVVNSRDALPADNEAIASPTKVSR